MCLCLGAAAACRECSGNAVSVAATGSGGLGPSARQAVLRMVLPHGVCHRWLSFQDWGGRVSPCWPCVPIQLVVASLATWERPHSPSWPVAFAPPTAHVCRPGSLGPRGCGCPARGPGVKVMLPATLPGCGAERRSRARSQGLSKPMRAGGSCSLCSSPWPPGARLVASHGKGYGRRAGCGRPAPHRPGPGTW